MAVVSCHIAVPPDRVFAVLCDGWRYSGWVVGTSHMRAVEAAWPAVGSRLFHASGLWPAVVRDETQVEEMVTDRRLVMVARGGAMGDARVELELEPNASGTRVTMAETPIKGPGKWINNPLNEKALRRRNVEALARLTVLAEEPTRPKE